LTRRKLCEIPNSWGERLARSRRGYKSGPSTNWLCPTAGRRLHFPLLLRLQEEPDGSTPTSKVEEPWGIEMRHEKGQAGSAIRLRAVEAPADENVASMIDVLQEQLKLAREGKLRSLAVVSVSADGTSIGTQWSGTPEDLASLIGKLTVLTHDLMAARR
jgi:hypothetical protein